MKILPIGNCFIHSKDQALRKIGWYDGDGVIINSAHQEIHFSLHLGLDIVVIGVVSGVLQIDIYLESFPGILHGWPSLDTTVFTVGDLLGFFGFGGHDL